MFKEFKNQNYSLDNNYIFPFSKFLIEDIWGLIPLKSQD